jgi:hypothetical protein
VEKLDDYIFRVEFSKLEEKTRAICQDGYSVSRLHAGQSGIPPIKSFATSLPVKIKGRGTMSITLKY